jgi:hypothetical protein
VASEPAMTPSPISTQDQTARPRICPKKLVEFSTRAGMYLNRTIEAMLPLDTRVSPTAGIADECDLRGR